MFSDFFDFFRIFSNTTWLDSQVSTLRAIVAVSGLGTNAVFATGSPKRHSVLIVKLVTTFFRVIICPVKIRTLPIITSFTEKVGFKFCYYRTLSRICNFRIQIQKLIVLNYFNQFAWLKNLHLDLALVHSEVRRNNHSILFYFGEKKFKWYF